MDEAEQGQTAPRSAEAGGAGSLAEDIAALVQREVEQVGESLRAEFEGLRQEAIDRAGEAARGTALLGAAGGLGLASAGALASLPLLALRRVLPGWAVALLVAGGSGVAASFVARAGLERLQAAAPEAVRDRVEQAKNDVTEVVRQRVTSPNPEQG